jgi:hypothetical protein
LPIAERFRDLKLRIVAKTKLEQQHYYRGEHEQVAALATDDHVLTFPKGTYSDFGLGGPASELNRCWLIISLPERSRFAEAAEHASEAIRRATATQPAYTVGWTHRAAGMIHLLSGISAQARPLIAHATDAEMLPF